MFVKRVLESDFLLFLLFLDLCELVKMVVIDIMDEEIEDWMFKVYEIVKWFGKLREIDLSNAEEYEASGREGFMVDDWM